MCSSHYTDSYTHLIDIQPVSVPMSSPTRDELCGNQLQNRDTFSHIANTGDLVMQCRKRNERGDGTCEPAHQTANVQERKDQKVCVFFTSILRELHVVCVLFVSERNNIIDVRWVAKATELNRHTTRMKIRGSVVSLSFVFSPFAGG